MWSTAGVDDEITSSAKVTREIRANNGGGAIGVLRAGGGAERPLCGFHLRGRIKRPAIQRAFYFATVLGFIKTS